MPTKDKATEALLTVRSALVELSNDEKEWFLQILMAIISRERNPQKWA